MKKDTYGITKFEYDGPIMLFGKCICDRWRGSTFAISEKKAKSNFAYQFKKQNNLESRARITLPGKITIVGRILTYA